MSNRQFAWVVAGFLLILTLAIVVDQHWSTKSVQCEPFTLYLRMDLPEGQQEYACGADAQWHLVINDYRFDGPSILRGTNPKVHE